LQANGEERPLLDVGRLLGRKQVGSREARGEAVAPAGGTVLVVNSSEVERNAVVSLLGQTDRRTLAVRSADEAWEVLGREAVNLLICDLRLPEMNAQRLAELRRRTGRNREVPILLVLSHAGGQSHLVVRQLGAKDFVRSPIHRDELLQAIRRCVVEA
jgi:CheY-like chemotaxis protein